MNTERDTTVEERMSWGDCPTCGAKHGEFCHPEIGVHLGHRVGGGMPQQGEGAHVQRLRVAPMRVKLVPA